MTVALNEEKVKEEIQSSHDTGFPLLICLIATKACYIKFSGIVRALSARNYPFIALESGQHHEYLLTQGAQELGYHQHLAGTISLSGDLSDKSAGLFKNLHELWTKLKLMGARSSLLVVCGDTLTAGVSPYAWYLITGQRSVHIESGLRSMSPRWQWIKEGRFLEQRYMPWFGMPTRPFPEGLCTRIATVSSQQLFPPVQRNYDNLIQEGYDPSTIFISGSPSVDAVEYAKECVKRDALETPGEWLRVDIHRRENLTPQRLNAIFDGIARLSASGIPTEFVITKSMQNCKGISWNDSHLKMIEQAGVVTSLQTASYISVVRFLLGKPLAIFTDSGGLQEESAILGVPCITCRSETDRPETVMDFKTNILVPPTSGKFIFDAVSECLSSNSKKIWPGLGENSECYGSNVGKRIVERLKHAVIEPCSEVVLK